MQRRCVLIVIERKSEVVVFSREYYFKFRREREIKMND